MTDNPSTRLLLRFLLLAFGAIAPLAVGVAQEANSAVPPAEQCVVYQRPKTQQVIAARWSAEEERWVEVAQGKLGVDDRAVLQQACDSVPAEGGEILVKPGRYLLDETLFVRRGEVSVNFARGAVLAPAAKFAGYLVDISPEQEDFRHLLKRVRVTGLRIDGRGQSQGVRHACIWYFTHVDWNIERTRGTALSIEHSSIEGAFYDVNVVECGLDATSPAVSIGSQQDGADHANNISFFNFRIIFPHAAALEISNPPRQRQPVRNLYFYGTQVHWLIVRERTAANAARYDRAHSAVDMIRIRNGHDIHFLGGNFQMMSNRGRCFVLGEAEKVQAVTIKGRVWGGGEGGTHLAIKNADHLFLPCVVSLPRGTAVDWGDSQPTVHEAPVVQGGAVKGTFKQAP